jgi:two-component system, cell cycle response regulator DivK
MPGEPILIVDDTPVNLKLTRILLVNEGYDVLTAASAEEALELLRGFHPDLVLADIQLPGIDGLELTRRIKQNESTRDITVVALTAFAAQGDEQKALDAGCDGYITKPIDTRALGSRIRSYLERRAESRDETPAPRPAPSGVKPEGLAIPAPELLVLRRRFLDEGREQSRKWVFDLDGQFDAQQAARVVHQWIGAGGLLGYNGISRLSREVEGLLQERPLDQNQLRESLANLAMAFNSPQDLRETAPVPVFGALSGKRVGLVGLLPDPQQRLCLALERAGASSVIFEVAKRAGMPEIQACHAVMVHVRPETAVSPWLDETCFTGRPALVLLGRREHLLALSDGLQAIAAEWLMDSWEPEEALVRLCHAVSTHARPTGAGAAFSDGRRPTVLLADGDATVLKLVCAAIQSFGMDCHVAADGRLALESIRKIRPHVAVLDLNLPQMNGCEVLAAIRAEDIPVHVLLLAARQQDRDVIRGFSLGALDFVLKPFSALELEARIKRLLRP